MLTLTSMSSGSELERRQECMNAPQRPRHVHRQHARRLDRQLIGRCARQGEPGSCVTFVAPGDELLAGHAAPFLVAAARRFAAANQRLGDLMLTALAAWAQKRCERYHRLQRRDLSIIQDQLDRLLALSGPRE